jgi:coiled-coil domain-containing protein 6
MLQQAKAEQEEEFISNTLLKKIQALKKEKESLAHHYEREEECLTNDLSRKLTQLRQEKCRLEQTLEQEQECLVNRLMRKIEKLEAETLAKQSNLEQLRREKVRQFKIRSPEEIPRFAPPDEIFALFCHVDAYI